MHTVYEIEWSGQYENRTVIAGLPPFMWSTRMTGARNGETFRLGLNKPWEAVDIQTGTDVLIPKGSYKAVRILHRAARDAREEPWLVVTVQHKGKSVSAGLRESYWRQWAGHHISEFRVTIEEWNEKPPSSPPKTRP